MVGNVGSGPGAPPGAINLDIRPFPGVDVVGDATRLPWADGVLAGIVCQEVLEHLPAPDAALAEFRRVLSADGILMVSVPWIFGGHDRPDDYWRFSDRGLATALDRAGFEVVEVAPIGGPATAMHRILCEFVAIAFSSLFPPLYLPAKGMAAVALWPIRLLDPLLSRSVEAPRLHGGWAALARPTQTPSRSADA